MKNIKRLTAILLSALILTASLPLGVFAEVAKESSTENEITAASGSAEGTCGENVTWSLDAEGVFTVSGQGEMDDYSDYDVPWKDLKSEIKEVVIKDGVTGVACYGFSDCTNLTKVTFPDTLLYIRGHAFYGCKALCDLIIPESVTLIEGLAFAYCESLVSVTVPDSVEYMGLGVFERCSNLEFAYLGDGIEILDGATFSDCSKLEEIRLPDGLTHIPYYFVDGCYSLKSINIPNSVERIGMFAFDNCQSLERIIIPDSVTEIDSWAFRYCYNLEEIYLSKNLKAIPNDAFYYCTALTGIELPDSVTSIGENAFYECSSLNYISMPASLTSIGENAFYGCSDLKNINITDLSSWCGLDFYTDQIPDHPIYDEGNLYLNGELVSDLVIPEGVIRIGKHTFKNLVSLKTVTIPASVSSIGGSAFFGCRSLEAVYINDLDAWCKINFDSSSSNPIVYSQNLYLNGEILSELEIPDTITDISAYSFYGCDSLTNVTIPASVTSIGTYAFYDCDSLANVTIPASVTSIGADAFYGCGSLTNVTIPASVTSIGTDAFSGCVNLVIICDEGSYADSYAQNNNIPRKYIGGALASGSCGENMTWSISEDMTLCIKGSGTMNSYSQYSRAPWMGYASDIKAVTIDEGVTSIGSYAFYDCSALLSADIPASVTSIGSAAFKNCHSLKALTLPEALSNIGSDAFYNCSSLESINIPSLVTSIGGYAFYGCNALKGVYIKDINAFISTSFKNYASNPVYYAKALYENSQPVTEIVIPEGTVSLGANILRGLSALKSISIPDSVTSINTTAFLGCNDLIIRCNRGSYAESFAFENGYFTGDEEGVYWCIRSGALRVLCDGKMPDYEKEGAPWYAYRSEITSIVVEEGVTEIGDYAFYYLSKAVDVHIPASVRKIGYDAFYMCHARTNIYATDLEAWLNIEFETWYSNPLSNFSSRTFLPINGINCILYIDGTAINELVIPEGTEKINDYAFINASNITSVTIPESVRSIGTYAFALCYNVTEFKLSEGLENIDDFAFRYSGNMTSMFIPRSVTSIGAYAFGIGTINLNTIYCYKGSYADSYANTSDSKRSDFTCIYLDEEYIASGSCGEGLTWTLDAEGNLVITGEGEMTKISDESVISLAKRIYIGDGITSIPDHAFTGYDKVTDIVIAESVSSVGWYAFQGCTSLKRVSFSDPATERSLNIGLGAFSYCSALESVAFPEGTSIGASVFANCTSLKNMLLPATQTAVSNSLFSGCSALEEVTLSPKTQYIYADAFKGCTALESIRLNARVTSINETAFEDCASLTISCSAGSYAEQYAIEHNIPYITEEIYIASGSCGDSLTWTINDVNTLTISGEGEMYSYTYSFPWKSYISVIENVVIEKGVSSLSDKAFASMDLVKRIELPDSIQSIGESTFADCTSLVYINIPMGITSIPKGAFEGCTSLNPLNTIPGSTLYSYGLQLPEGVTEIGEDAFKGCSSLMSVSAPDVVNIGASAFEDCGALTSVSAMKLVTTGECAFKNCVALQSISGNDALESIGNNAYENCKLSFLMTLPASVKEIGTAAFKGSGIQYVFFNADINELPDSVFEDCASLSSVIFSGNMTKIGERAFYGCNALTTHLISEKTTEIGANAYTNCGKLGEIRIYDSTLSIGEDAFLGCGSLVIKCCKYSYAESYAAENNIPYTLLGQYLTSDGVILTTHGLKDGVKDFFIAKGDYDTYKDVKANYTVLVSSAKFGTADEFSYLLSDYGLYTVYIRYTDSAREPLILKTTLSGPIPELSANGLQLTLKNLEGVKVIRTAYGDFDKAGDIKRAEGQRSFSGASVPSDEYTIQYRENGLVSVAVVYENGYTEIFKHEIKKHEPVFVQEGNTVTVSSLDDLKVIRYAKGEYATSGEIKRAEGCVTVTPEKISNDKLVVTLEAGVYSFCVQYNDESYNYYIVTV